MNEEVFDVVNLRDEVIAREKRKVIHNNGMFHRAVHVFARDQSGKWIIQKRSESKDLDPGLWTTSCSGHVDQGESYFDAAVRECKEELGAFTSEKDLLELLRLSPCDETGKEFVRVYLRFGSLIPVGDPEEIEAFDLLSLDEIEQKIQAKPSRFSNSFVHIFKLLQVVLKKFT